MGGGLRCGPRGLEGVGVGSDTARPPHPHPAWRASLPALTLSRGGGRASSARWRRAGAGSLGSRLLTLRAQASSASGFFLVLAGGAGGAGGGALTWGTGRPGRTGEERFGGCGGGTSWLAWRVGLPRAAASGGKLARSHHFRTRPGLRVRPRNRGPERLSVVWGEGADAFLPR